MIYEIGNKKVIAISKNEKIELPEDLKQKIVENFENILKSGANVWNGEVRCVAKNDVGEDTVELICKNSDYAHYLYGERIGLPEEYSCKNLSAGSLVETSDNFYIVGELDKTTSYPGMLQVPGGNIDPKDIVDENINIMATIKRETLEELNIDLDDASKVIESKIKYLYISEPDEQPGVEVVTKVKLNMNKKEMQQYFEEYYKYLKNNNLEVEFGTLHFLKKENALKELEELENPKRKYLTHLIEADMENKMF